MPQFTNTLSIELTLSGKGHQIRFPSESTMFVPDSLTNQALALGLSPADGDGDAKVGQGEPDKVNALVEAMLQVMATGDASLMTNDGQPRAAELEKIVGFKPAKAEREAAWDLVSLKDAESE